MARNLKIVEAQEPQPIDPVNQSDWQPTTGSAGAGTKLPESGELQELRTFSRPEVSWVNFPKFALCKRNHYVPRLPVIAGALVGERLRSFVPLNLRQPAEMFRRQANTE